MAKASFIEKLKAKAAQTGFDACRVTQAELPVQIGDRLREAVSQSHHGTMEWMKSTLDRRITPRAMWNEAQSAILLGVNYSPHSDPMETLDMPDRATISVYARNRDYHDVIKGRLKTLASWLVSQTGEDVKVFVDTAPLMEKPLAQQAGLGWQGKHTNLVSRKFGSWLFLGSILTTADLPFDDPEVDHCGSCRSCLDICPTKAFPRPYQLDARRCISYLTIEHQGPIAHEFREDMGNRIFGCDDCLAVCPWNKFAQTAQEAKLKARKDLHAPKLEKLAALDDPSFRKLFSGSPIKRIGRDRFIRNVMIAVGNSGNKKLKPSVLKNLDDTNPVVRGAAIWALSRLEKPEAFTDMRKKEVEREPDAYVRSEWNRIS